MSGDLMFQEEIRGVVRDAYRQLPAGAGRRMAARLYDADVLGTVPEPAVGWALGVGDPVRDAGLRAGEVVLDLGCGGGIDAVLAAERVGDTGRVIGLDLLPEMCERARLAAELAGVASRCEFVEGVMEDLPLPSASVDVVISNGALNLSPRKSRALAEVARVLVPGGRVCIADLAVEEDLPPEVLATEASWAGCIAGAVSERVLVNKMRRVGLVDVEISGRVPFGIDDVAAYPLFSEEVLGLMRRLIPGPAQRRVAVSLLARAVKPVDAASPIPSEAAQGRTHVRHLSEIEPADVEAPGVVVRHLKSVEDVDLKVLDVEPGGSTPFHVHHHAHEGVVVDGLGALRLVDGVVDLAPGDVFFVRPNERHAIMSRDGQAVRFVCMDCLV
jgi:arsenite methyltransferase